MPGTDSLVDMVNDMPEDLKPVTQKDDGAKDQSATGDAGGSGRSDSKKSDGSGADDRGDADDKSSKGGSGGPEKGSKEGSDGKDGSDKSKEPADDEPDGYVADEDADEDKPKDVPNASKDAVEPKSEPSNLSSELQFVVDNLPTLTVRGKTVKGTETFQVKAAGQLPEDFEFLSKRDELLFNQALAGQELRARELQSKFVQDRDTKSANEFSEKENKDIRKDIGDLQREGRLPRFKLQPDNPEFSEDPGVKEAQNVIDYMNKRNAEYLEAANKGGVLYHLSFKDAFAQMPRPKSTDNAQDNEDKERKQVTRQTAGAVTSGGNAPKRAHIARNMDELINRFESMEY